MASRYAQVADLQKRIPQFVMNNTSKPTIGDAQTFIEVIESLCESGWENLGYRIPLTPLTGTAARLAEEIVCQGAGARVLYARAAAVGGDAAVASADRMQKKFDDMMAGLADQDNLLLEFQGVARNGDELAKPFPNVSVGLQSDDDGNAIVPHTTIGQLF